LDTRRAILLQKSQSIFQTELPLPCADLIAGKIQSNVRELEAALNKVMAYKELSGDALTESLVFRALKELFEQKDEQVTLENIQRTVADHYKIKLSEMLSKKRTRTLTLPRQMAIALSKEFTRHSLVEIGAAYGSRDHSTVLYALKRIEELRADDPQVALDYKQLHRKLTR
jgi:chromosomal replication initiator protein